MNIEFIKNEIKQKVGRRVELRIYGLRHKIDKITGVIEKVYPNLFIVTNQRETHSINYADIATKEVEIRYL